MSGRRRARVLSPSFVDGLKASKALGEDVRLQGTAAQPSFRSSTPQVPRSSSLQKVPTHNLVHKLDAAIKIQKIFKRYLLLPRKPSLEIAARRFRRLLPRSRDGALLPWLPPPLSSGFAEVEGVGAVLALRFQLEMGLLLGALFACSLFALGHNIDGEAIEPRSRFSLPITGAVASLGNASSLDDLRGISEGGATLLLALALLVMRRSYGDWVRALDAQLTTISDFALELRGLPPSATASDVSTALRKALPGAQIIGATLALDEGELLTAMSASGAAHRALRELTRKLVCADLSDARQRAQHKARLEEAERHRARAAELDARCAALRAERRPCTGVGFAVCNRVSDAERAIALGTLYFVPAPDGCMGAAKDDAGAGAQRADAVPVEIVRAPEPSDVLWPNLHVSRAQGKRRQLWSAVPALGVILLAALVMGLGRGMDGGPLFSIACLIFGNVLINKTLPAIAMHEGWHHATRRDDSLCAKLSLFQVLNSISGALIWLARERGRLSPAWWEACAPMVAAVVVAQVGVSNGFGLLRLGQRVRRRFRAPRATTQADANALWESADPLFVPVRMSLVLKYASLAIALGPLFPMLQLLGACSCLLSCVVDSYLLLRQLSPVPHTNGRLVLCTALERVLPCALVSRALIALAALGVRSRQLALELPVLDRCALWPLSEDGGGGAREAALQVLRMPAPCNAALLWATAGGAAALLALGLGLGLQRQRDLRERRARTAAQRPLVGGDVIVPGGDGRPSKAEYMASAGLGLYLSPTQQRILRELASQRGDDPLSDRAAFSGETIALSIEVALWSAGADK